MVILLESMQKEWIDISNLVDINSISIVDSIDESLGSGAFIIPFWKNSKKFEYNQKIIIEDMGVVNEFLIQDDDTKQVRYGNRPLWQHVVTLIEPTKQLQNETISDMTVTQPVSSYYITERVTNQFAVAQRSNLDCRFAMERYFGFHTELPQHWIAGAYKNGIEITKNARTIDLTADTSTNPDLFEGNVLKKVGNLYTIRLDLTFVNVQFNKSTPIRSSGMENGETTINVDILLDNVVVKNEKFVINSASYSNSNIITNANSLTPSLLNKVILATVTTTRANQVVNFRVSCNGDYINYNFWGADKNYSDDICYLADGAMELFSSSHDAEEAIIKLNNVAQKILDNIDNTPVGMEKNKYKLAQETIDRLSTITSFDITWLTYTAWDALKELANFVGAIPRVVNFDTVVFDFFDIVTTYRIDYNDKVKKNYSENYATALEMNTKNIINANLPAFVKIEPLGHQSYMSVRLEHNGYGEVTDENASLLVSQDIDNMYKFIVRGVPLVLTDINTGLKKSFPATKEWDISSFVVEKAQYNALENITSATNRTSTLNKGNTVYYVQGENKIKNLVYNKIELPSGWNESTPLNYAIVEAIMCQAITENPGYLYTKDQEVKKVDIFDLLFRIYYQQFTKTRATIYKEKSKNSNQVTKYYNEQSQINDGRKLGNLVQNRVNAMGNEIVEYTGVVRQRVDVPKMGNKTADNEVITNVAIGYTPNGIEFTIKAVVGFRNLSEYVGVDSRMRQYEIPKDNTVVRLAKIKERWLLGFNRPENDQMSVNTVFKDANNRFTGIKFIESFNGGAFPSTSKKFTIRVARFIFNLGNEKKDIITSIKGSAFGNTIVLRAQMADNYSAGAMIYEKENIEKKIRVVQEEVRYVTGLGRFSDVEVFLGSFLNMTNSSTGQKEVANNLPNMPSSGVNIFDYFSNFKINYNKDAREVFGMSIEASFDSDSDDLIIYSGFTTYNNAVVEQIAHNKDILPNVEVKAYILPKGYFPKNIIDKSRLTIPSYWNLSYNTVSGTNLFFISSSLKTETDGEYEGVMIFLNDEPALAYRTSELNSSESTNKRIYLWKGIE